MAGFNTFHIGNRMSNFTEPLHVYASTYRDPAIARSSLIPPGFLRAHWIIGRDLTFYSGDRHNPTRTVTVPRGFVFDGASVPPLLTALVPRSHPAFLPAAALHDWIYSDIDGSLTRREADDLFFEALLVLQTPAVWARLMWTAVRAFGIVPWTLARIGRKSGPHIIDPDHICDPSSTTGDSICRLPEPDNHPAE